MNQLLPGQLPPQAIDDFQALWKKHYDKDLPRAEATARAHQLLALLQIITEPIPETQVEQQEQLPSVQKQTFREIKPPQ